jgi:CubicO group peptidase (beta-lactamase class C family)
MPSEYYFFRAEETVHHRLHLLLIPCLVLCLQVSVQSQDVKTVSPKAAAYMTALERTEGFSGVVLIARYGHILFAHAYGMANLEHDVPNTLDTKFRMGSVTKQFTAVAILILQERRKLSVGDSILPIHA